MRASSAFPFAIVAAALHAQTVEPVPGTLTDGSLLARLPASLTFEQQIQLGTQANSGTGNPFAYLHGLQFRPWLHYDGLPHTTLTFSISYINYFNVPESGYYKHPEWRDTLMGTVKQSLSGGSVYEQVRAELLNFRDSHGTVQHVPRLRLRVGQNLYLGEGGSTVRRLYLGFYEEAILQFPRRSYSGVTLASARFFGGAGSELGRQIRVLLGLRAEGDVASSGSTVTLFYGPAFSIEYNLRRDHPLHENHQRTTAFKDF
jgi:hypothetical protein